MKKRKKILYYIILLPLLTHERRRVGVAAENPSGSQEGGEEGTEQWSTIGIGVAICRCRTAPPLYPPSPTSFASPISHPTTHPAPTPSAKPAQRPSPSSSSLDRSSLFLASDTPGFPSASNNSWRARALAMASTSSSTPAAEVEERGRKRKRAAGAAPTQPSEWRTRREHEIYSSRLLEAIRLVRAGPSSAAAAKAAPTRSRAVREAADRALAVAARGRTHWSRAILASRRCRRLQAAHRARLRAPASPPPRHGASAAKGTAALPPVARKAMVLGRLVPGCRKLSFPTLLAETTDYIAALQMQVRAMTALAEALSAVSSSSSGAGSSPSSSPA
jgi:hypothetical protein